ncbi:MAG: L-serine ammonia-lyase, iron-sulfur-dependent, subunit alpha [Lachnospiraceae bacterium]|nr:L-serine ammonia-lyase, iron-sulfur-dependent, subunit alpha [Lachnospiraceae bacterium]MDY5741427.1 L-serine ammonia-lyase, iron-sulfur-dependent, subunit alpha [Lachnospiraceae bacterium]
MKSLREVYKIGHGPSSSHTMGPGKATADFVAAYPQADRIRVILYDSLAKTGMGHHTDRVIEETVANAGMQLELLCNTAAKALPHPNTMDLFAFRGEQELGRRRALSIGGGTVNIVGEDIEELPEVYQLSRYSDIAAYCIQKEIGLWEYVEEMEGPQIWDYLLEVWEVMNRAVTDGLKAGGELAGGLHINRKAGYLFQQKHMDESAQTRENRLVCAYAFAVSEQNASAGLVVTAPTCGACGVLPAVLRYMKEERRFSDEEIVHALAVGGLIGNLIKSNASVSGAECGCQAEIGSACSMAAAALAQLFGLGLHQIEYAAEVAMEHHLGLTCDPINGLVQIPCIERNAVAAMRAINAVSLANFLSDTRKISFDMVVDTMYRTGIDMAAAYKETAEGGLASLYHTMC